jgi:uncharacterized protein YcgL (UPF0745 family)
MKIDIYTSATNGSKYLSVLKGVKVEDLEFPADFDSELLRLSPFRTRLELHADKEHNAVDKEDVLKQIEEKGYAVHGAKFEIDLTAK